MSSAGGRLDKGESPVPKKNAVIRDHGPSALCAFRPTRSRVCATPLLAPSLRPGTQAG